MFFMNKFKFKHCKHNEGVNNLKKRYIVIYKISNILKTCIIFLRYFHLIFICSKFADELCFIFS